MIYPKKNEKCPMMSHYIPLNPRIVMVATRRSPPWDELCRLEPFSGWIFDSPETMERYEKNMATFLMVSYQWFISMECWWFIYIYISFGMWFGNINERLIWKKIRFGTWFGNNEIFEGSSWDLTRSFMVLAVHGWKFSPDWLGLCIAKFDGRG